MGLLTMALVLGATIAWAFTWLFMRMGVRRMNWVDFGFVRPWISLPLLALYAWATDAFAFGSTGLIFVAFAGGVANAFIGTGLFYYAHTHGSMHETNILANTGPFWGVVSAIVVLGEPARWATFAAGALVVAGTALLVRGRTSDSSRRSLLALLAGLGAGVLWGFTRTVPTKLCLSGGMSPVTYQFLFTSSAAVAWSAAVLPRLMRREMRVEWKHLGLIIASSVLGIAVGWILWLEAIKRVDVSLLSPWNGLILLFSTLLGVLVLRERLTLRIFAGGGLVLAGVTLVSVLAR